MYKPDVYLIMNSKDMIHQEQLEKAFGKHVNIKAIHYWSDDDQKKFDEIMATKIGKMVRVLLSHFSQTRSNFLKQT